MRIFFALLKKCALRRCRNTTGAFPFGFLLEVLIPLGFFYLFSWVSTEIDSETVASAIPGDVYSTQLPSYEDPNQNFVEYVNVGYSNASRPTCQERQPDEENDSPWKVSNKASMLIDCTPSERFQWATTLTIEDACESVGQDVFDLCQKRLIGLAPSDSLKNDPSVALHLAAHADYLRSSFHESVGKYDLVKLFDSESELVSYIKDPSYGISLDPLAVGIIWNGLHPEYDYTIRMNTTDLMMQDESTKDFAHFAKTPEAAHEDICWREAQGRGGSEDLYANGAPIPEEFELGHCAARYINSRFVHIQTYMVDSFILEAASIDKTGSPPDFHIQPNAAGFPYEGYTFSAFWQYVGEVFSVMLYLSFLMTFYNTIKQITEEKELKLTEGLKIMGVTDLEISASWWMLFLLQALILTGCCMITAPSLFVYSSKVLVFMFLFWYIISCTSFCIFISSFFSKARRASLLGFIIFFFGVFIPGMLPDDKFYKVMVALLHPGSLFMYTSENFIFYETNQIGVTSNTASEPKDIYSLAFNECLILMIFDTFSFIVLSWYVVKVMPSDYGVALPPHFIFMPTYWKTGDVWSSNSPGYSQVDSADISISTVEDVGEEFAEQERKNEIIQIKKLRKVYNTNKGEKVAVSELDLNFYKGQVSCLLGHNGAGKTTTINVLNGMTEPTSGSVKIGPYNVGSEMSSIRRNLGVCPQHDVLFLTLTVQEHLKLFATIKGIETANLNDLITKILEDVGIPEKRHWRASALSGGQKRKLSLAIAFLGDSEYVFLDEPTSGMDPYSRRSTWEMIRKKKEGRVIVLTTHFMDEADLLGDRISIMSEGSLRCSGSSLFLKKEFGVGYNITMEKNPSGRADDGAITALVKKHVPSVATLSSVGMEIAFQLPLDSSSSFSGMLSEVDVNLKNLGLVSYGISVTTLEEVFLTIARGALKGDDDVSQNQSAQTNNRVKVEYEKVDPSKFWIYTVRHCVALLHKRWHNQKRDYLTWIASFLFPLMLIALGMYGTMLNQTSKPMKSVALSTDQFGSSKTPVFTGDNGVSDCISVPWSAACQPDWEWRSSCNYNDIDVGFITQVIDKGESATTETVEETYIGWGYDIPLTINCTVSLHDETMALGADEIEVVKVNSVDGVVPGVNEIAKVLQTTRDDFQQSRFGALFFPATPLAPRSSINHNSSLDGTTGLNFLTSKVVEYVAMVNFTSAHAFPTFVSLANEMIVKSIDPDISIKARSTPFPKTIVEVEVSSSEAVGGTIFAMLFALPFVPAAFGAFAINERVVKAKHIQFVSGVTPFSYWFSMLIFDFSNFCISACIMLALLYAFDIEELTESGTIDTMATFLFVWGAAAAVFAYFQSFFFNSSLSNFGVTMLNSLILGYMGGLTAYILGIIILVWEPEDGRENHPDEDYSTLDTLIDVENYIVTIGHFLPTFCLAFGLQKIQGKKLISLLNKMGEEVYPASHEKIAMNEINWLIYSIPIYFSLVMLIEFLNESPMLIAGCMRAFQRNVNSYTEIIDRDDDVIEEDNKCAALVNSSATSKFPPILVNGLKKQYGFFNRCNKQPKLAVRGVSFTVEQGVCFGLLGVNGAGKTSTLGMVTGEFPPSEGQAFLAQRSIMGQAQQIKRLIGYCPQFDPLFPLLTGREHLQFYARLKGVKEPFVNAVVDEQIKRMDLVAHCDRTAGGYSGGNKRKLSVACALIGDPKIVFLDEPSTGMDPLARRFMWSIINQIAEEKISSIILTTHSMEECEALCSKIGIMVDGYFRCLGSGQHLKNKFGQGYQIEINAEEVWAEASAADVEASALSTTHVVDNILKYFRTSFPHFQVLERQEHRVRLNLQKLLTSDGKTLTIGDLFGTIESVKSQLKIVDYSISQTSLEQIFNGFAKQQAFTSGTGTHAVSGSVTPEEFSPRKAGDNAGYLAPTPQQAPPYEVEMVSMGQGEGTGGGGQLTEL